MQSLRPTTSADLDRLAELDVMADTATWLGQTGLAWHEQALADAARGTGHGRTLLRAAVARAHQQHGAGRVWLDVKPNNLRARALYRIVTARLQSVASRWNST